MKQEKIYRDRKRRGYFKDCYREDREYMVKTTNSMWDTSCDTCICNNCKMNEVKGIYDGCLDCEDCKDGDMHCEDCTMFEKETK